MARTKFWSGVVVGAVSTLVIGGLVVLAAGAVWLLVSREEPPDPTATRREVIGTVMQMAPRVCVDEQPEAADQAVPDRWCGVDLSGVASEVAVGDSVEGTLIGVELDPGSGDTWSIWESLSTSQR